MLHKPGNAERPCRPIAVVWDAIPAIRSHVAWRHVMAKGTEYGVDLTRRLKSGFGRQDLAETRSTPLYRRTFPVTSLSPRSRTAPPPKGRACQDGTGLLLVLLGVGGANDGDVASE